MKIKELKKIFCDRYTNIKLINSGGNATVYSVKKIGTEEIVALKILDSNTVNFIQKRDRFIIETNKVKELQSYYEGIIPIFEYDLPDDADENLYWYTMPVAKTINQYFRNNNSISDIVKCVIFLANTLSKLHKEDIVHRDIKPSNIYFYNEKFCIADFGLVDYPEKKDLTRISEQIGAKATIAPEMKRDSINADGKRADVYSLAKTLWMLLTKNEFGFEGIYNQNSSLMKLEKHYEGQHLVELTKLLIESTQDEPDLRPTMYEFAVKLSEYLIIYSDFEKSNLSQWQFIQEDLFGRYIPESTYWKDINDIVKVINLLGSMPSLNHMFISSGGGLDFDYAEIVAEEGCIALHASSSVYIIKPSRLIVENIQKDFKWSYFRLEVDELKKTGLCEIHNNTEYVTEHLPGQYISWICGNYGYYEDDESLPKDYRLVTRVLSGSFVLFSKASIYNDISGTYDARHNMFEVHEFRNYVEKLRQDGLSMSYANFMEKHNPNPFKDKSKRDEQAITERIKEGKSLKLLIKNYFYSTDFCDYCMQSAAVGDSNVLRFSLSVNFNDGMFEPYLQLGHEGIFVENASIFPERCKNSDELNLFPDYNSVRNFINKIEFDIRNICNANNLNMQPGTYYFSILLFRNKPPTHIFTREEIKEILLKGNDHKNNTLIIDGYGYVKLIEEDKDYLINQYPVRHESYNAYNNYTGKYSSLTHLEDVYISSLQGWLKHLKYGGSYRMDYLHGNVNEEELLKEIAKYYIATTSCS